MPIATAWLLAARRVPGIVWAAALAAIIGLWDALYHPPTPPWLLAWTLFFVLVSPLAVTPLRRALFSAPLLRLFRRIMPVMSDTEREALEAGTVWWEAELFGGRPRWKKLFALPAPTLSAEEQAFLDGPCDLRRQLSELSIDPGGGALDIAAHRRRPPRCTIVDFRHRAFLYFFLPSLRKMYSPTYFTPLPL